MGELLLTPPHDEERRGERSTAHRWIASILASLVSLFVSVGAIAQNCDLLVADPIRLSDLRHSITLRTAKVAGEDRWKLVEEAHDAYLAALRALRSTLIDPALATLRAAPPWQEDPASLRARRDATIRIAARIATIEATLFDALKPALGDEFADAIDGVRAYRALRRVAAEDVEVNGFVLHMDLGERALRARSLVGESRSTLVRRVSELDKQQLPLVRRIIDGHGDRAERIVQRNHHDPLSLPSDGEASRARFEEINAAFPDIDTSLAKLTDLRRRFLTETLRALPVEIRRDVRQELLHRKQLLAEDGYGMERRFRAMLRSTALDAGTKDRVRELYHAWIAEEEQRAMAPEIDLLAGGHSKASRAEEPKLRAARDAIAQRYLERLRATLPDFRFDNEIEQIWRADAFAKEPAAPDASSLERRAASEMGDGVEDGLRWRMNMSVRPPDARLVLAWLSDATQEERALIDTLLTDAAATWAESLAPRLARATTAERSAAEHLWQPRADMAETRDTLRSLGKLFTEADAATTALFASLRAALPEHRAPAIDCAEIERRLEVWVDDESLMAISPEWEWELAPNIARVVRLAVEKEPIAGHRAALVVALIAQGPAVLAAARDRRLGLAELAADRADLSVRAAFLDGQAAQAGRDLHSPERLDITREQAAYPKKLLTFRRAAADTLRAALARLTESLNASEQQIVRLLYEREAYPERFVDRRDATPIAERAITLIADDAARVASIRALLAEHRLKRAQQVIAFVDSSRASPANDQPDAWAVANMRLAREHVDRSELHTRLVFALRRVLSAEECARIRSLADYERLVVRLGGSFWNE